MDEVDKGFPRVVPGSRSWSVSALLLAVSDALAARFSAVTVRGELSGFSRAGSGHCYFILKDDGGASAGLRCAMFRRHAQRLDFVPVDGQQVEARGRLAVYEARGELQLVVESLQRVGSGALYEEFLRLRARLEAGGWFAPERKRALPPRPGCVGLITSLAGAALHDVVTTLRRRAPHLGVVVYPSLVQGADAPASLVAALAVANARAEVEVLLLCRGGGSLEDLWAFNSEAVVMAVAESALPVVCGVGHETDLSLADLAADLRAPTPTAAAELVAPSQADLLAELASLASRMRSRIQRRLDDDGLRLDQIGMRLRRPAATLSGLSVRLTGLRHRQAMAMQHQLGGARQTVVELSRRLEQAMQSEARRHSGRLELLAARLRSQDPRQVLSRGYTWVEDGAGQPISSISRIQAGDRVRAVWADGTMEACVERVLVEPAVGVRPAQDKGSGSGVE